MVDRPDGQHDYLSVDLHRLCLVKTRFRLKLFGLAPSEGMNLEFIRLICCPHMPGFWFQGPESGIRGIGLVLAETRFTSRVRASVIADRAEFTSVNRPVPMQA